MRETFDPIKPGDPINLENDLNSVRRVVQRLAGLNKGDGISGVSTEDFHIVHADASAAAAGAQMFARITDLPVVTTTINPLTLQTQYLPAYPWVQSQDNGDGTFTDLPGGLSGSASTQTPLFESNGSTLIPPNTVWPIYPSVTTNCFYFSGSAVMVGIAQLTSGAQPISEIQTLKFVPSLAFQYLVNGGAQTPPPTLFVPNTGTFPFKFNGQTSATAITTSATAAQVQACLQTIPSIGLGGVQCSGGPLPNTPITIQFSGVLANSPQNLITPNLGSGFLENDQGQGTGTFIRAILPQSVVSITETTKGVPVGAPQQVYSANLFDLIGFDPTVLFLDNNIKTGIPIWLFNFMGLPLTQGNYAAVILGKQSWNFPTGAPPAVRPLYYPIEGWLSNVTASCVPPTLIAQTNY